MLKGHATIDLHDTQKGTYKRIEQDNLVTNAYKHHLQSTILMNGENNAIIPTGANGALPLATVTLGGLMLFDGALTESADNVVFPGDVHLMGYADNTSDNENPLRGSYNTIESGATGQGYTHVWDFSTAQGNGTIGALSLTNIKGGADPIGCCLNKDISGTRNTGEAQYMYHDGVYAYFFSINGNNAIIDKYFQPQTGISVKTGNFIRGARAARYTVDMSGDDNRILYEALWQYAGDGVFVGAYVLADNDDERQALSVRVARITTVDWENFVYSDAEDILLDGVTGRKTINVSGSTVSYLKQPPIVSGNHIYIRGYAESASSTVVYVADLNNTADINSVTIPGQIEYGWTSSNQVHNRENYPGQGGTADFWIRYGTTSNYDRVRIYPDATYRMAVTHTQRLVMRGLSSTNAPINAHFGYGTGSNWGVYMVTNYLGTICNLATPIQKTAAQTMKITYNLTDVT